MTIAAAYQPLFKEINRQLEAHSIIVKTAAIVDASVIDTPLKPKGKTTHRLTRDREDLEKVTVKKEYANNIDKDGSWLRRAVSTALVTKRSTSQTMKVLF